MNTALASNVRTLRRTATHGGARRVKTRIPARVKLGTARASCVLTDVSKDGACLAFTGTLDADSKLWLIVDNLPPIAATAAWRTRERVGVKFEREQDWLQRVNEERFANLTAGRDQVEPARTNPAAQNEWKEF